MALRKEYELFVCVVKLLGKFQDLLVGFWFLLSKLIAGESQNFEVFAEPIVKPDEICIVSIR